MLDLDPNALAGQRAPLPPREGWRARWVEELAAQASQDTTLSDGERAALARAWHHEALAAHAALAFHAQFTLQLLNLGAAPRLLSGSAQAMQHEVAFTQACFSLARRYARSELGPSSRARPLRAAARDTTSLVLELTRRGCIEAAVQALCAREALEHCEDPATREVLLARQAAKARQAQLAWRFVAWALEGAGPELHDQVRVTCLTRLTRVAPARPGERERTLMRHGVLGAERRSVLEQRVLRDVVLPCLESVLRRTRGARGDA